MCDQIIYGLRIWEIFWIGTIDFIFGDAAAVFQNCDIFVRRPMDHQGNMITAQGRDNPHENTGNPFA